LILVFERQKSELDFAQEREIVICEAVKPKLYKILTVNSKAIYSKYNAIQCDKADAFSKLVTKKSYFTIEEFICGRENTNIHEYFTFKYENDLKEYILNRYSIVVQQKLGPDDDNHYVIDEFPIQTLTKNELDNISIKTFDPNKLNSLREKFRKDIYDLFY
jgi:hypothetical protein